MSLLFLSFVAGILTVLAPCTFTLLPVIVGGSLKDSHAKWKPWVIALSLSFSIILFTLVLKFSTALISIPQSTWNAISASILIVFGLITLFPQIWEQVSIKFKFGNTSNKLLNASSKKKGLLGDALIGFSLGPVFSSCSPVYFVILGTVLPQNFSLGLLYLIVYSIGLSGALLLIAFLGQRLIQKLKWAVQPNGWFKRILGMVFIAVGIFIFTGADKKVQACVIQSEFFPLPSIEEKFLKRMVD